MNWNSIRLLDTFKRTAAFSAYSVVGLLALAACSADQAQTTTQADQTVGPASTTLPGYPESPDEPAAGVKGVALPTVVRQPAANYRAPQQDQPVASLDLFVAEPPTPKRPGPRRVGQVDPNQVKPMRGPARGSSDGANDGIAKAPATATSFESIDFVDNSANTSGSLFVPPDTSGAAGPNHVVSVANVSIQFHTKDGTGLLDTTAGAPITGISLASFFSPLSPVNATFDPKVIYDQHANRFAVVTLELQDVVNGDSSDTSRILLAVSDDSDPNGTWYFTAIDSKVDIGGVDHWADYPGFAVDEEAVYITANMFEFLTSGGASGGTRIWIVDKFGGGGGGLYGGGTVSVSVYDPVPGGGFASTMQPAHVFGVAPTSPNIGTWLSSFSGLTNGTEEFLQIVRITDPIGPGATTFVGPTFIDLGNIDDLGGMPDAPQSGSAETIETNDRRALQSVWRDDKLYVVTTIDPKVGDPNAGEATAHWVEVTATASTTALSDQGSIGGEDVAVGAYTFFPSISVNDSGDIAMGYAISASTIFPTSGYTTHLAAGAAGSNTGSAVLTSGLDYYIRTFDSPTCSASPAENRWGDYSGMAVDPFDECFWVYNQYAQTRGTGTTGGCNGRPATEDGRWGTTFGYFCESCATNLVVPDQTVSGTTSFQARDAMFTGSALTVAATGDLTFRSNTVEIGNGFTVLNGGKLEVINGACL